MTGLGPKAALLGAAAVLLIGCGQSGGGGGAASSQPAASSAPPPAAPAPPPPAAASDTAASSAAASLPPLAAAPPVPAPAPAAVAVSGPAPAPPPKRQPTAAELLRDDPAYQSKDRAIEALYGNARDRDPTGQVAAEHAQALAQRRACADKACLDSWFRRREAALKQYVEN